MKSCELDILKYLKSKLDSGIDIYQSLDTVSREVATELRENSNEIKQRLEQLLADNSLTLEGDPSIDLVDFFKINGKYNPVAYTKVKQRVREIIIEYLFNDTTLLATNDENTNLILTSMSDWFSQNLSLDNGNTVSKLAFYFKLTKNDDIKSKYLEDYDLIAHYLIAAHLPTIVNSWFKDILVYNSDTDTYSLEVNSAVRRDWYDDDTTKEANLNSLLKIMLEATPIMRFNLDGTRDYSFSSKRFLTKNAFFYAFAKELELMPPKDYYTFLENPHYIITYLKNKYSTSGQHSHLHENIIHSFLYKWIYNEDGDTYFTQHCLEIATKATGFNPLDVIIKNIGKYTTNTYLEYDLDNNNTTKLSLGINENSRAFPMLEDNITNIINSISNSPKGILTDKEGKWYINDDSNIESLSKYFFGQDVIVNDINIEQFKRALQTVLNFRNKGGGLLSDYLDNNSEEKSNILSILDIINAYNPYAISGSIDNAIRSALPTIGLSTVSGSIKENIYRLISRNRRVKDSYRKANLPIPTAPYEQSMLYKAFNEELTKTNWNLEESSVPFKSTVYRTTISQNIDGNLEVKETGKLSIPEAFRLSIYTDFLDNWKKNSDQPVRIQAITVSDKPKIPFFEFSSLQLKEHYGFNNQEIERNVLKELRNIYKQNLLNTVNNFIEVLGIETSLLPSDASTVSSEEILNKAQIVNSYLIENNITTEQLNDALFKYNTDYRTNKLLAKVHDFEEGKSSIIISPYLISTISYFSQEDPLDALFAQSLHKLPKEFEADKYIIYNTSTNSYQLTPDAKQSDLYTYFLMKTVLQENILVNTVGLPFSHKHKGKSYEEMDSKAHLTMVKRMVALTATMHACDANSLNGLSNEINLMTIKNDTAEMFAYSGNSSEGKGFRTKLEVADGAMYGTRAVDNLLKQSIADTKPKGIDLKLLLHYQHPEHGGAELAKLASYTIDNNLLRRFADDNIEIVGGINPLSFMKLAFRTAKFRKESFREDLEFDNRFNIIDFNGREVDLSDIYVKEFDPSTNRERLYEIANIYFDGTKFHATKAELENNEYTGYEEEITADNDLYSFWKNILGGEYSCDADGQYGEQSQDHLSELLNIIGIKYNKDTTNVEAQQDVDQYLKKEIVHYFPTSSGQKSLQLPTVNIHKALQDPTKAYTIKTGIENFGIQMDADHEAADGQIKEITQLISFITEHGYVPNKISYVYSGLANLLQVLARNNFINVELIKDPSIREQYKQKLDKIFAPRIVRVFTNPNTDSISLANEIMKDLAQLDKEVLNLLPPYSDNQMIGKIHTTIGSYLNKFISRNWNGRGDVLVPSHNMFMIYEDEDGTIFTAGDYKFINENTKVPIIPYLRSKVWETLESGERRLRSDFINGHLAHPYEVMPGNVFYRVDPETLDSTIVIINNWDILKKTTQEILNGVQYVKAIDLPRNLKSKQVFLKVKTANNTINIGLYHTKTLQLIADIGDILSGRGDINKYPINKDGDYFYNGKYRNRDFFINEKVRLQRYFNETILPAIYSNNIEIIEQELPIIDRILSFNYVVTNPERATTNNYSNKFGIKNMNFSEIMQKKEHYFKERLLEKFDDFLDLNLDYDYILYTASGTPTLVYTKDAPELSKSIPGEVILNDDGFRIDTNGRAMYKWPEDARLYHYKIGNKVVEIIKLNDINDLVSSNYFAFYKSKQKISKPNLYKITRYNKDHIIDLLAQAQYESWKKSNTAVMSRIPAQSLSFAMNIDTVVYLPYNNNIAFVPNEQVFLQGSDYDIDKAYSIMFALGNNGIIKGISSTIKIIPEGLDLNSLSIEELNLTSELESLIIQYYNNDPEYKQHLENIISNIINSQELGPLRVSREIILYDLMGRINIPDNRLSNIIEKVLSDINLKLFIQSGLSSNDQYDSAVLQNAMLNSIIDIYNDPRTLFATNYPTTMDPINDVVSEFDLEAEKRNHLDFTTDVYVNQTTAVGKMGIGISANAQKAFYALTYYNLNKYLNNVNLLNPTIIEVPSEWVYDTNLIFSLGFADSKYNQASIDALYNWIISGSVLNSEYSWKLYKVKDNITMYQLVKNDASYNIFAGIKVEESGNKFVYLGDNLSTESLSKDLINEDHRIKVGDNINNLIVTTVNSSIISSATDNAKEMKLDLLNMTPEVMPAYEYCISIGMTVAQAAKIFTDPIIPMLIAKAKGNLYHKELSSSILSILNSGITKLSTEFVGNTSYVPKLRVLLKLFKGAEEIQSLASILSINGGIKVELGSALMYQLLFEKRIKNLISSTEQFSLEQFLYDSNYKEFWINKMQESKQTYNILEIINSVPHYMAMLEVPIQFKHIGQILSKDLDNTTSTIYNDLKFKYKIDEKTFRTVLRVFNDRKLFDFLRQLKFTYSSPITLSRKKTDQGIVNSFVITEHEDAPETLSTDSMEGLVTLKTYIERYIITPLKVNEKYKDNAFISNLIYNTRMSPLSIDRIGAFASRVNTTDSTNIDLLNIIKQDWYDIQDDVINGHSLYEWFFLYDLLCYKRELNKNSLSLFLDGNIDLSDENNIVTKYVQYINSYDNSNFVYQKLYELYSIPNLEPLRENKAMMRDLLDLGDDFPEEGPVNSRPSWLINQNYLPLFINMNNFGYQTMISKNLLSKTFAQGNLLVSLC